MGILREDFECWHCDSIDTAVRMFGDTRVRICLKCMNTFMEWDRAMHPESVIEYQNLLTKESVLDRVRIYNVLSNIAVTSRTTTAYNETERLWKQYYMDRETWDCRCSKAYSEWSLTSGGRKPHARPKVVAGADITDVHEIDNGGEPPAIRLKPDDPAWLARAQLARDEKPSGWIACSDIPPPTDWVVVGRYDGHEWKVRRYSSAWIRVFTGATVDPPSHWRPICLMTDGDTR